MDRASTGSTNRRAQSSVLGSTSLAGIALVVGVLFVICILSSAGLVKPTGTDFCSPGQSGVLSCPCNNPPTGGGGCQNYGAGQGALLTALGVASVTDGFDTVQLQVTDSNSTALTVFLQSSGTTMGMVYGAGVSCLAGPTLKLYAGNAGHGEPAGQITRPLVAVQPSIHERSAALGDSIAAGQTRYYMAGYRDKNASAITNCNDTNKTFNSTQGVAIVWGP
jgi:hypothetical protein